MAILILILLGFLFLSIAIGIIVFQWYSLRTGRITVEEGYDGPKHVSETLHVIIRLLLKQSIYVRKFCLQYVFHIMVRVMYHFDVLTTKMYAMSRNWFVKNAVKNKGTVPHFWEHLKVYKQEMDEERKQEENK